MGLSAAWGGKRVPDLFVLWPLRPGIAQISTAAAAADDPGPCNTLRSGCADPFPARSCLGGPETARIGRPPPPRYRTRSICRALPRRKRVGVRRARRNPASRSLANLSQAGGDTSPAVLPSSPPWT